MQQPIDQSVGQRIGESHLPRKYLDTALVVDNIRYIIL